MQPFEFGRDTFPVVAQPQRVHLARRRIDIAAGRDLFTLFDRGREAVLVFGDRAGAGE